MLREPVSGEHRIGVQPKGRRLRHERIHRACVAWLSCVDHVLNRAECELLRASLSLGLGLGKLAGHETVREVGRLEMCRAEAADELHPEHRVA